MSEESISIRPACRSVPPLEDFGNETIHPRPFLIEPKDNRGGEDSRGGSPEHVGHVICSDIDARHAHQ